MLYFEAGCYDELPTDGLICCHLWLEPEFYWFEDCPLLEVRTVLALLV
jgi:hypothetical protein